MALPLPGKYCARHSMLKMRLGAVPLTDVNMPYPPLTKYRSSQYGKIVYPSGKSKVSGMHDELSKGALMLVNDAVPFDDTLMLVNVWSYSV